MNKSTFYLFILFALLIISAACSGKKDTAAAANEDEWPVMDEFHMVMAESFHPYKDSANLEPAKAKAAEMASLAEKWAAAPVPKRVDNDETKADLNQLKDDTAAFTQIVQSGDSTKIGESLTALHDLFHKLQEAWYSNGKEKTEHH